MFALKKTINRSPSVRQTLHFDIFLQNCSVFEKAALFTTNWNKLSGEIFKNFFSLFIFRQIFYFLENLYFSQWDLYCAITWEFQRTTWKAKKAKKPLHSTASLVLSKELILLRWYGKKSKRRKRAFNIF